MKSCLMTGYHGLAKCSTTLLWQLCACVSLAHIAVMVKSAPLTELIIYFLLLEGQWKSVQRCVSMRFCIEWCQFQIPYLFQEIAEHSSSPEYGCTATFLDSQIENFTEITYFEEKSTSYFIRKLIEGFCIHVYLHLDCA